jgi:hypothetical protein
VLDLQH